MAFAQQNIADLGERMQAMELEHRDPEGFAAAIGRDLAPWQASVMEKVDGGIGIRMPRHGKTSAMREIQRTEVEEAEKHLEQRDRDLNELGYGRLESAKAGVGLSGSHYVVGVQDLASFVPVTKVPHRAFDPTTASYEHNANAHEEICRLNRALEDVKLQHATAAKERDAAVTNLTAERAMVSTLAKRNDNHVKMLTGQAALVQELRAERDDLKAWRETAELVMKRAVIMCDLFRGDHPVFQVPTSEQIAARLDLKREIEKHEKACSERANAEEISDTDNPF